MNLQITLVLHYPFSTAPKGHACWALWFLLPSGRLVSLQNSLGWALLPTADTLSLGRLLLHMSSGLLLTLPESPPPPLTIGLPGQHSTCTCTLTILFLHLREDRVQPPLHAAPIPTHTPHHFIHRKLKKEKKTPNFPLALQWKQYPRLQRWIFKSLQSQTGLFTWYLLESVSLDRQKEDGVHQSPVVQCQHNRPVTNSLLGGLSVITYIAHPKPVSQKDAVNSLGLSRISFMPRTLTNYFQILQWGYAARDPGLSLSLIPLRLCPFLTQTARVGSLPSCNLTYPAQMCLALCQQHIRHSGAVQPHSTIAQDFSTHRRHPGAFASVMRAVCLFYDWPSHNSGMSCFIQSHRKLSKM